MSAAWEISDRKATLTKLVDSLAAAEEALQSSVDDARQLLGGGDKFKPLDVSHEVILALARTLGRTTYAPHGWPNNVAANEERRHAEALYACLQPPVPTEQHVQASALHHQLAGAPPPPPGDLQQHRQAGEQPDQRAVASRVLMAADEHGLTAESLEALLKLLPPRPPGWKPGDPLPAWPQHASAAVASVAEAVAAEEARRAEKEEALAYVPRVAMEELNPDLEVEFDVVAADDGDDDSDEDME